MTSQNQVSARLALSWGLTKGPGTGQTDLAPAPAKDFIRHLLERDPQKRFTCQQALQHLW